MVKKKQFKRVQKKFLSNKAHEHGAISWGVKASTGKYTPIDAYVRLNDCDGDISFSFDCYNEGDHKSRLKKIDTLIRSLQEFREAFNNETCRKIFKNKVDKENKLVI